jgi:multiple sugar transport system permease protein
MIDFLDTQILKLTTNIAINVILVVIALATLYLVWLARQKKRQPLIWFIAGLGGYSATYALVMWILPAVGEDGQPLSKWQTIWRDPEFRADVTLAILIITGGLLLVQIIHAIQRQAMTSPQRHHALALNRVLNLIYLLIPLVIWLIVAGVLVNETPARLFPLLIFVGIAVSAGLVVYYLIDSAQSTGFLGLGIGSILLQAYYNTTIEQPTSLLAAKINIPIIMPLIPLALGWIAAKQIKKHLPARQYTTLFWDLGWTVWIFTVLAFFIAFFGEYEFGGSYASDLAVVMAAPLQFVARLAGSAAYQIVPREIPDAENLAALSKLNFGLAVAAGFIMWLSITRHLYKLPSRTKPFTLADWSEKIRSMQHLSLSQQRYVIAIILIAPAILLRAFTMLYPFLDTFALSFQRYNPAFPPRTYVDFRNFERLAGDLVVRQSLEFTLLFVFVSTLLQVVLGLAVAHLLNAEFRFRGFSRMISLIPWAIPMVVVGIASRWLFDDNFGMIPDLVRRLLGFETNWLIDPVVAKYAVISVSVWKSTPFVALILLAGLQGVPQDLYEAARVDGASYPQQLRFITIPMLLPIIVTITMFMLVWQLAAFDLPFTMTGGGPGFSTTVLAQKIYLEINSLNYSYAAALSIVLVGLVAVIGGVGMSIFRRVEVSQ